MKKLFFLILFFCISVQAQVKTGKPPTGGGHGPSDYDTISEEEAFASINQKIIDIMFLLNKKKESCRLDKNFIVNDFSDFYFYLVKIHKNQNSESKKSCSKDVGADFINEVGCIFDDQLIKNLDSLVFNDFILIYLEKTYSLKEKEAKEMIEFFGDVVSAAKRYSIKY